jgi:hypothetical protein
MFYLENYGIPDELHGMLDQLFTIEHQDLAKKIEQIVLNEGIDAAMTLKDNPAFKYALSYLAWIEKDLILPPIIYNIEKEDLLNINFDWLISFDNIEITFSNAYFLLFYNQLYKRDDARNLVYLSKRGVILRALADLSFVPWDCFELPVSEKINHDFLFMPFLKKKDEEHGEIQ